MTTRRVLAGPTYRTPPERPRDGGWPSDGDDPCTCRWHPFGGFVEEADPDCPEHGTEALATELYPADWAPRGRGVAGGRDPVADAVLLLMAVAHTASGDGPPVAVTPSGGSRGTVAQWDAYGSTCDARALICLAAGDVPDPGSGHAVHPPGFDVNSREHRMRVRRTWPRPEETP